MPLAVRETAAAELMDDPDCDPLALDRTYDHFALVNRLVAGWRSVYTTRIRPLAQVVPGTLTVLDLGSGGGDVSRALAAWARSDGLDLEVTAIDPDPRAFRYASSRPGSEGVRFECASSGDLVAGGRRFDVVVSNHVLHHLDPAALAEVLGDSERLATRLVVHNDIRRSALAYAAYWAATVGTFRGSFIHPDGLLSIRRSYRAQELAAATPAAWTVARHRPWRLLLSFAPPGPPRA